MKIKDSWIKFLATGFYSGMSPIAPGTMGTLVGLVLLYLSAKLNLITRVYFPTAFLVVLAALVIAHLAQTRIYEVKDDQEIVIDEIAGYFIAMYSLPLKMLIPAFVLFRIFDIWKPELVNELEELEGGLGVVGDDLGAGLMTALLLNFILLFV